MWIDCFSSISLIWSSLFLIDLVLSCIIWSPFFGKSKAIIGSKSSLLCSLVIYLEYFQNSNEQRGFQEGV